MLRQRRLDSLVIAVILLPLAFSSPIKKSSIFLKPDLESTITTTEANIFGIDHKLQDTKTILLNDGWKNKIKNIVAQHQVTKQRRTALIIGNANYRSEGRLNNPVNDATDIADSLRKLGFEVTLVTDANIQQMEQAIEQFNRQLRQGGVGLFYFSGHGIQVEGENYLIPIDTKLNREQDVRYEAYPVGKLLNAVEDAANQANIIILDACRNNPFAHSWRSTTRGLAVPTQPASGVVIAYSTAPGKIALDGEGRNSPYTSAMLHHINTTGLDVMQMFQQVRADVHQQTQGEQTPWESSSLIGEFVFNPGKNNLTNEVATSETKPLPSTTTSPSTRNPSSINDGVSTTDAKPSSPPSNTSSTDQTTALTSPLPSLPQPSTTTEKPRIAVLDFDYSNVSADWIGWWNTSASGVSDILVNKLVESGNFVVVERSKLAEILKEQNLGLTGRIDAVTAAQVGKILGVDTVVLGSITDFNIEYNTSGVSLPIFGSVGGSKTKANVKLNIRVVNTTTGEILFTAEGNSQSKSENTSVSIIGIGGVDSDSSNEAKLLTTATVEAINQVVQVINNNYTKIAEAPRTLPSVTALVADIYGNSIIVNKGLADGYCQGMKLSLERVSREVKDPTTGKVIRQITQPIGTLEITEADAQSSVAKIISGTGFKVGDVAKPTN